MLCLIFDLKTLVGINLESLKFMTENLSQQYQLDSEMSCCLPQKFTKRTKRNQNTKANVQVCQIKDETSVIRSPLSGYIRAVTQQIIKKNQRSFESTKQANNLQNSQIRGTLVMHQIYNGFATESNNIFWGAGLSLAWQQFKNVIQVDQIVLDSADAQVLSIVQNFNNCLVSKKDIDQASFLIQSGLGDQAIQQINKQVSIKFPNKTLPPLQKVGKTQKQMIVLYSFFMKDLKFKHPFVKFQEKMLFKGVGKIDAFEAIIFQQKEQILIHNYENQNNFMIQLLLEDQKHSKDQLYLIKSQNRYEKIQEIVLLQAKIQSEKTQKMMPIDVFRMPFVNINAKCTHENLIGQRVVSNKNGNIKIMKIQESINVKIDEKGVTVQNEGIIQGCLQNCLIYQMPARRLILDSEFWIVMKQKGKHPYLVVKVANPTHG